MECIHLDAIQRLPSAEQRRLVRSSWSDVCLDPYGSSEFRNGWAFGRYIRPDYQRLAQGKDSSRSDRVSAPLARSFHPSDPYLIFIPARIFHRLVYAIRLQCGTQLLLSVSDLLHMDDRNVAGPLGRDGLLRAAVTERQN